MHAYFDEFVHSRSTLKQFMEQYDMAMGNKIQKEFIADFQSKNKVVKCVSTFCWEKQFQRVLSSSIFKLVQEQINHMMYCQVIPSEEVSNETGVDIIKELRIQGNIVLSHYAGVGPKEHPNRQRENTRNFKKLRNIFNSASSWLCVAHRSWNSLRKDALVNWVPTTSDNVPPSQTTQNTEDLSATPILNPVVTAIRGRPRSNRYISRAEERSRGHGRRARGRGVGRSQVQGQVGGRGSDGHDD
ncbi:hypothetical protein ACS0TY_023487 [Phlomoides rotata]